MYTLNGITLRDDQREIAESSARFKVVACGRRWGKTTLGLVMAIEAARKGQRVWWVAPTFSMGFLPWLALKAALADEWESKLEAEHHITLEGGGSITVKSADNPNSLRGVGLDFVILDEAAFMRGEAWIEALRPALSDRKGRALLISTPRARNWFWAQWQRGADPEFAAWQSWHAPTRANPLIPQEDIEEAQKTLPHFAFEQEYLAQFIASGGEVFRTIATAAMKPEEVPSEPEEEHEYVMGVDFGRYNDFTVCAVIDTSTKPMRMVAMDRFNLAEWRLQRQRIAAMARRWNVSRIHAETNSMGEPNIEALRDEEDRPVIAFTTTAESKRHMIDGLVMALEEHHLKIIPDEVLINELSAFSYEMGRNHLVYRAPSGDHDDTVIALALAWALAHVPGLVLGIAETR